MSRFRARWYTGTAERQQRVAMQRSTVTERGVPEAIARLAYEEYANQGHGSQSFDRLHERGGFSETEIVLLLADLIERERARANPQISDAGEDHAQS